MMQTCEQYAVERLVKLDAENKELQDKLQEQVKSFERVASMYLDLVNDLKKMAKRSDDGSVYISFDTVWEKYDKERYERFSNLLFGDDWENK